jgi:hypothetical protein
MEKSKYLITACSLITLFLLTNCTTVKDTLYLREAEVSGPIMPAPIHLTDSINTPSFTISPRFSYNTQKNLAGDIDQYSSYYSFDTTFVPSENSLAWNITSFNAGVDMDFAISKVIALSFGASYSSQSNYNSWGGNFGLGFNTYNAGTAFRVDVGMQINSMRYDAYTVVRRVVSSYWNSGDESVFFYHDIGTSTHFDPYFNFTFNTAYRTWPVNIFFNAGYVVQTLFSFEPKTTYSYYGFAEYTNTDLRGTTTAGFINITPGVFFYLNDQTRCLVGSRFYIETQIGDANPNLFIMPMMQVDFSF